MPDFQVYTGPSKLVMAFDIGTTFSGISYSILEPGKVPEIFGVTRFPAQELVRGDAKVPSLLYYDKDGNFKAAGAEVLAEDKIQTALEEKWTKAEWWKLHLCPGHLASSVTSNDDLPPLPAGKTAVDVLADFVKYLFECTRTYIKERHLAFTWTSFEDSIEYIFTHPNGWEGIPQQLYRQAIEHAGLIPCTPEGRSRVHMLTEGEASLHFCVPNFLGVDGDNQANPQGVVIIDVGGGTVDLSMFSMKSDPVTCEEIAAAECRLQGSVFVTRRARALLKRKLEGWEHSSDDEIADFTHEFDQSTKLTIKSDQEPSYVRVSGRRYNNPKYDIRFGKLRLSGDEATGLFSDSIDAIISAFEQQEKRATIPITVAFLVGGLSINDWLWSRVQSYFEAKKIKICRPDNHINKAVANGAVFSYIDSRNYLATLFVARATYGMVCALPAKEDDEEHARRRALWEQDPTGDRYVPGFFEAKLRKGEQVTKEMQFRESFSLTESNPQDFGTQTVCLVCHRGKQLASKWVDEDQPRFSVFCTIQADLSKAAKDLVKRTAFGQVYYQLDYAIIVHFGFTELKAELCWETMQGEEIVPATILFEGDITPVGESKQPRKTYQRSEQTDSQRITELEQRNDALSTELASIKDKLKNTDHIITSLTADVDRWKCADAQKAEQLSIAHEQVQKLQKDLSTSAAKLADFEARYEAQSHELVFTREQLQKSESWAEEIHHYYDKQLRELKVTIAEHQPQLFEAQRFVTLADEYATWMITQMLQNVNIDIQSNISFVTSYFSRDFQLVEEPSEEQTSAAQRIAKMIGQTPVDCLGRSKSRDDVVLYLAIALRAYLAHRIHLIISSWTIGPMRDVIDEVLDKTYETIQQNETSTVAGRWRSLTRTYILSSDISDLIHSLTSAITEGLSDIVVVAGCARSASAANETWSKFRYSISLVISAALRLRKTVMGVVSSDFEAMAVRYGQSFDATRMEVDMTGDGEGQTKKVGKVATRGRRVLCGTSLGLTKRKVLPESDEDTSTLVKARVFLENSVRSVT